MKDDNNTTTKSQIELVSKRNAQIQSTSICYYQISAIVNQFQKEENRINNQQNIK